LAVRSPSFAGNSVIPGFRLSFGVTVLYLSLIVLGPLGALSVKASGLGLAGIVGVLAQPRVLSAFRVSFGTASAAAVLDSGLGLVVAWALVRYPFPGRRLAEAAIDLPFALPTAVAGIALTSLYADTGWLGGPLAAIGINVAYTRLGILVALIFVGLPFSVRTLQPLLIDLDRDVEEAALTLGATGSQIFARVILPPLIPAMLTGAALAFARGVGEYGSVIFIAGNMPGISEIVPLLIVFRLEQFDYAGAAAIATVMLVFAFSVLLGLNLTELWIRRSHGG
jgi:sulfate/thiosulfate transport system permease protein